MLKNVGKDRRDAKYRNGELRKIGIAPEIEKIPGVFRPPPNGSFLRFFLSLHHDRFTKFNTN